MSRITFIKSEYHRYMLKVIKKKAKCGEGNAHIRDFSIKLTCGWERLAARYRDGVCKSQKICRFKRK